MPAPDAQRRAGGEPRRAGRCGRAATAPEPRRARICALSAPSVRERRAPDGGRVDEGLRARCASSAASGMPMSASRIGPQSTRPGSSRWPGLRRKNVTLALASTATPRTSPVSPSRPEGTSTATTRPPARGESVDALDDRFRDAVDVAREPGPEQSVDDEIGAAGIDGCGVEDLALVARGGERRIAPQRFAPADEPELDRVAALCQEPRGDEAVAAVAAGAAEDDDPAARLREPRRLVGDREARALHQRDAWRSGGHGEAVGLAHFGRGQEFRARLGIEHGGEGARPFRPAQAAKTRFPSPGILLYPRPALIPDSSAGRAFDC